MTSLLNVGPQFSPNDEDKNNAPEATELTLNHPPVSLDDFIKAEHLNEWPRQKTSEGILDMSTMSTSLMSFHEIQEELASCAPTGLEVLDEMEIKLQEFFERLKYFSTYFNSPADRSSKVPDNLFHVHNKDIIEKAPQIDVLALHHSRKAKKDMTNQFSEIAQSLKTKTVDFAAFPGFRMNELTELPKQLEAPQILNKVTEAQTFNKGFHKLWKKIFLSEASVSLLQDTFWWFYFDHFEHNARVQDRLFTRIADSYVALFASVNADIRDKFFAEFPRCLAQAVYIIFCEAFPESLDRFTEEFIAETSSVVSEWISGTKSPVGDWKKWPWDKLGVSPGDMGTRTGILGPEAALGKRRTSNKPRALSFDVEQLIPAVNTSCSDLSLPAKVEVMVTDETGHSQTKNDPSGLNAEEDIFLLAKTRNSSKSSKFLVNTALATLRDSAQAGPGPDYERVLFNLSGRSPLVAHHLYMKHLRDKESAGKTMKRTEVIQQPSSGMTYQDVIKNSKKRIKSLQAQREKSLASMRVDIAKLRKDRQKTVQEITDLQNSLKDPMEIKLRSDKILDQALERGIHRPADYGVSQRPSRQRVDLFKEELADRRLSQ